MDAIAVAAEVGKGTLFRRFGDKAGLAVALLDAKESELQQQILSTKPPLGRSATATPEIRLRAFYSAYLDYVFDHLSLVRMSETASVGARYRIGAYRFWHRHTAILIQEIAPNVDAEALAHTLLAALAAEHLTAMVDEVGEERTRSAIHVALDAHITALRNNT